MIDRCALILVLLLALGGCSSITDPASPDTAELVLSQPSDKTHPNLKALVDVNGARAVELERQEGFTEPIRPGPTLVSVSGATRPGHYGISFNAQAGKTYRLEISSRSRNYIPSATEMTADYATVENEGPFKIVAQPPSDRSR